ncbi:hypothetical protein JIX56_19550 [Streptomyces sp. CA-210063]|uniref:hypothetical protein n=1 Tax=Streptomyces sp. CA-210063 TaxID=2801029 RepID=UPI00214ADAAB|nr:hypothetical protein [Streptomyces sp. CA-210063]UUU31917.1 hypothetical protein JIX56_19550 [Streptomyces sp. CA-210063]
MDITLDPVDEAIAFLDNDTFLNAVAEFGLHSDDARRCAEQTLSALRASGIGTSAPAATWINTVHQGLVAFIAHTFALSYERPHDAYNQARAASAATSILPSRLF